MNARIWVNEIMFIVQKLVTSLLTRVSFLILSSLLLASCFGGSGGSSSSSNLKTDQLGITLQVVSGDNQFAAPEQLFAMPLIVKVVDPTGGAIPGMEVTFTVTDPSLKVEVLSPKVTTDQNGIASSQVRAPDSSNVRVSVEAKIVGSKTGVFFASLESRSFPETPTLSLTDSVTGSDSFAVQTIVAADITNGGSVTKWCLSELQSSRPETGASVCLGGAGALGGWTDSKPNSFTLNSTNGLKTVYLWVADQFNQVSMNPVTDSIMFDNTPPGIPTLALSDIASGSTTDTAQAFININISGDGDATQWCVKSNLTSEALFANPDRTDACWVTTEPTQHELAQLGVNRVYVWLMDQAGNMSASYDSKTINFVVNSMPDPLLALSDPTTSLTTYARQLGININISSDTFARKWCVSETQTTRPITGSSACAGGVGPSNGWYTTEPTTFSLSTGDGSKTVYVWVANPFNDTNENAVTQTITLDTTPPSIPIIDLKDPVTNQPNFTNQNSVLLQVTGDNNAVSWCVFEGASNASPPSFPLYNNACWVGTRPSTAALSALGSRRVYLFTKDSAQNVSPAPAVGAITYTTTAPSDPILVLRDTTTNSTTLAMSTAVSATINSPSGTTRWCVSETQTTKPANGTSNCAGGAGASNGWFTTAPTTFALSGTQGAKTVYVWVADGANNVNANASTASITLDTVVPPTPTLVMSDPNSGSQTNTNQLVAAIAVTNDAQATKWCRIVKESSDAAPTTPALTEVCWTGTRPTTVFLEQPGDRKLYLFVRDAAGNVSVAATSTIEYTTAVPADATIAATHAVTGLSDFAKTTAVNINISGDTDAVRWCVSETQTNRPMFGTTTCAGGTGPSSGWFTSKPTTFTLSAAQGLKRIYVWTANAANNVNNNPSNAGITLDSVVPATPTISLADPNTTSTTNTNQSSVNLTITGDTDASAWCLIEQDSGTANPAQPAYNNACFSTSKPLNATLGATGSRKVFLYTRDAAYNVSAAAGSHTITYSTTAPATPALALSDASTSSVNYIRQLATQVSITSDTGAVKWCLSQSQNTKPSLGTSNCVGGTGSANGWLTTRPTTFNVSATDALKTVYVWTADVNNNVSATAVSDTITLDTLPPSTPIVLLSDTASGSTALTNQATVDLSITADTDATAWCRMETSSAAAAPTAPLYNNACWVATRPTTATLTATGGRRVYVYTKDVAENISPVPAVGMITYSTTPPADPTLTLRDQTTNSSTHAITSTVNLGIGSPAGTLKWCVSETQNTKPAAGTSACNGGVGGDNGWYTSLPTSLGLSTGQGAKTVYIWVSDSANNVNANASFASITVDSDAPAAPTVVMADQNTSSTTQTNQVLVNLAITNDAEAVRWCKIMQDAASADPTPPTYGDQCWLSTEPTTHYMDATGNRKIFVYIRDASGNISDPGTATITYSTSTPNDPTLALADSVTGLTNYNKSSGLAVTIGNDTGATRWCISETQSSRPLLGTSTCAGGSGASSGWHTARPTTWTVSAGAGQKRIYIWIADSSNNVNSNPISTSIIYDTAVPATPSIALVDPNTGSSANTNQAGVTLNITADTDATAWCVVDQVGGTAAPSAPAYNHGCFVTSRPSSVTLGATGNRDVYVFTRDVAYNVSAAAGTASINYSTSTPATPTLAVSDPTTSSSTHARQVGVTVAITGDTNATKWCLSETQSTKPSLGTSTCNGGTGPANGWLASRPTAFSLSGGDAAKTVYVWTADVSNNVSSAAGSQAITLDSLTPATPFISLTDPNTSSNAFTNQSTVSLAITSDTDATAWCSIEQATVATAPTAPLYNNACWVTTRPTTATLNATGNRRLYLYTKDVAGNVSSAPATAQINYSTTAPANPALILSNAVTGSQSWTSDRTVSVAISSPAGATKWCLSETQTTKPASGTVACNGGVGSDNGWDLSMPSTFQLSTGDALKTVYIWVADAANNVNATASTDTINLREVPPTAPTIAVKDPNTNSAAYTNQLLIDVSITNDTDATAWCLKVQAQGAAAPGAPAPADTCWLLSRPGTVSLVTTGNRTVYAFIRDAALNVSSVASADIEYLTTAPANPSLALLHPVTNSASLANSVGIDITVGNDAAATHWCVSESQGIKPNYGTSQCVGGAGPINGWYAARPTSFNLSAGDGQKRVYVWVSNQYNTVNTTAQSALINLDTSVPNTPTITLADPNTTSTTNTNQSTVNLSIVSDTDATAWCVLEQAAATADPAAPAHGDGCFVTPKPTTADLGAPGSRKVFLYTRDSALNVSSAAATATIAYSVSAPTNPLIAVNDGTTGSTAYLRQSASVIAITNDTGAVKWCVSQAQTTKPSLGTSTCSGGLGSSNGWYTTRPTSYNVTGSDGNKTIYVWTADVSNNVSAAAGTDTIALDTLSPATPLASLADPNTGSSALTNVAAVDLSITSDTDAVLWCVLEASAAAAAPAAPLYDDACFVTPRPTGVTLGALGNRRVYVYTQDLAANVSLVPAVGTINYTTTPPANPILVIRDPATNSTAYAKSTAVDISVGSPAGTIKWCVSETQSTKPTNGTTACTDGAGPDSGWYNSLPTSFTLSNGEGVKTVYVWAADSANNVNATASSAQITLDTLPPDPPTVVIRDPNTNSSVETNQVLVNLSITADADAVRWCKVMQADADPAPTAPTYSDPCWLVSRPATHYMDDVGDRKIYVYLRDAAGNISNAGTDVITYSTTSPGDATIALDDATTGLTTYSKTGTLDVTIGSDTGVTRWCISETQSSRPLLGTAACNNGTGGSNGWHTARPTSWTVSANDGPKRLYIWTANSSNNVSLNPVSAVITFDTDPPPAPTVVVKDPNTNSTANTNQSSPTIVITGDTDATAWCRIEQVSTDPNPSAPAYDDACFVTSRPTSASLTAVGNRKVFVFTRDAAYNVSSTAGNGGIAYSTTPPADAVLALADGTTSSTSHSRQTGVNASITGDTNAVKWCLSEFQTTQPSLGTANCTGGSGSANGWYTARPTTFTLSGGDATKTIYLWTADVSNNVSANAVTDSITSDTLLPSTPFISLEDPNTGSTAFTNEADVVININSDTDAVAWCALEQAAVSAAPAAPLFSNGCWVGIQPTEVTLAATGNRRVYLYTKDVAGNVSSAPATAQINYSTTPPNDPVLVLSNAVTGSRTWTNDPEVSASISNPAGAVRWCLSETQTTKPANGTATCAGGAGGSNGWNTSMPTTFELSNGDALKTVYLWVADGANNVNSNAVSTTINLKEDDPPQPTIAIADPNTSSGAYTNQNVVSVSIGNDAQGVAWCLKVTANGAAVPAKPGSGDTCWSLSPQVTVALGATGVRTVYSFVRDAAMNVSDPGSDSIDLSVAAPADPTIALFHAGSNSAIYANSQAIAVTIGNDAAATRWCVSEQQAVKPTLGTSTCVGGAGASSGWYTARPTTFNLSATNTLKRVYVWLANEYNNVSDGTISETITLDTQLPGTFTVSGLTGGTDALADDLLGTTLVPTVNWNASTDAASYGVSIRASDGTTVVCAEEATAATSYTFSGCTLTDGVSYKAYVRSFDAALNQRNATNTGFDFTATLTAPGGFTIAGASGSQDTVADQWAGTSLPTATWTAASGAANYYVRILANDGVTAVCPLQTKNSATLTHDYSTTGCAALSNNTLFQIEVSSKNTAGNSTSATNNFFVFRTDLSAPTGNLTSLPAVQAITATANFVFTSGDAISGLVSRQCSLDGGAFGACDTTTTKTYGSLADGHHDFTLRLTDNVGLVTDVTHSWDIDTVLPGAFTVTGATGATDHDVDAELRNDNKMIAHWTDSSNEDRYYVSITDLSDVVICGPVTKSAGSTSHSFSSCTLDTSQDYKIRVVAERGFGTQRTQTLTIATTSDNITFGIAAPTNVESGDTVTITGQSYLDGVPMTTGGLNPTASFSGGTSTGTFGNSGTWTDNGDGTYQISFTGVVAGTATTITAISGGPTFSGVTTDTIQVLPGDPDAGNSTLAFATAGATVTSASVAQTSLHRTATLTLRDAANNLIPSGHTITMSNSTGVGVSTVALGAVSNVGNGTYTANVRGILIGTDTTLTASVDSNNFKTFDFSVIAGVGTHLIASGVTTVDNHTCSTPVTVTLKDVNSNETAAASTMTINFSGISSGNFSFAPDCSTTTTSVGFSTGLTSVSGIYFRTRSPADLNLTFSKAGGGLTDATLAVDVHPVPIWIGVATGASPFVWGETTGIPGRGYSDGQLNAPEAVAIDGDYLYSVDQGNDRLSKYKTDDMSFVGWTGRVYMADGLGPSAGCLAKSVGSYTDGWCTGGASTASSGTNWDGALNNPAGVAVDDTYVYVADGNHRIVRFNKSTGAYGGWFGRVHTTNLPTSCTNGTAVADATTPGWCMGGNSQTGVDDGQFNTPSGLSVYDDGVSTWLLIADRANFRVQKIDISNDNIPVNGGWIGRTLSVAGMNCGASPVPTAGAATPGWCTGGTSQIVGGTNFDNMFSSPRAIAMANGNMYVTDYTVSRVTRHTFTTGAFNRWVGRTLNAAHTNTGDATCTANDADRAWCYGGANRQNAGTLRGVMGIAIEFTDDANNTNDFMYVTMVGDGTTPRVFRMNLHTPYTANTTRWVGRISTSPTVGDGCNIQPAGFMTPGWCGNGTPRVGNGNGHFNASLALLAYDSAHKKLYTADATSHKIQIHASDTGVSEGYIGARGSNAPTQWQPAFTSVYQTPIASSTDDYSFYGGVGITTGPSGIATVSDVLYVVDSALHRIKRYTKSTGALYGWFGKAAGVPTGGEDGCDDITASSITPGWCLGSTGAGTPVGGTAQMSTPRGIAAATNSLYVVDTGQHRVVKFNRSNMGLIGWIGRINSNVGMDATNDAWLTQCTGTAGNLSANRWCIGGTQEAGTGNTGMSTPLDVTVDATDTYIFVSDSANGRVNKYDASSGQFAGWIGRSASAGATNGPTYAGTSGNCGTTNSPSPGWCIGASNNTTLLAATNAFSGFITPRGVAFADNFLYVADSGAHRVLKFDAVTGEFKGWIGRISTQPTANGNGYTPNGTTTFNCTDATNNPPGNGTPGWCKGGLAQSSGSGVFDNAFNTPYSVYADASYVFVVDYANSRITKHDAVTGAFLGWYGSKDSGTLTGGTACASVAVGSSTGEWCKGGVARAGNGLGEFNNPLAISGDTNFVYVTDSYNNRVQAIPKN